MSYDAKTDEAIVMRQHAVIHSESSVKAAFLRKVYGLFFLGILVFAGVAALATSFFIKQPELIHRFWYGAIIAWMILSFLVGRMLANPRMGVVALILFAIGQGVIFGPLLAIAYYATGGWEIIGQALLITVLVFGGLTGYVLITKDDFSFLGGFLSIMGFFLLGVVIVSLFMGGLAMGSIWSIVIPAVFILFFSMYVLYDTSIIMKKLPPQYAAAGAAMLFLDFAGMLYYILILILSLTGRD